jgi:hypothetical protein
VAKDDAMQEPRAQRTLVKSPPELWSELSDIDSLARHLGEFGEIRITRLDPDGTVELEPSGWGTKVTITAELAEGAEAAEPEPGPVVAEPEPVAAEPEPEPVAVEPEPLAVEAEPLAAEPEPLVAEPDPVAAEPAAPPAEAPKVGLFARLFGRRRKVEPVVEASAEAEPEAEPVAVEPVEPEAEPVDPEPVAVEAEPVEAEPVVAEPVAVEPEPEPVEPGPAPLDEDRARAILTGVLDDLGSAHHRPFSRS